MKPIHYYVSCLFSIIGFVAGPWVIRQNIEINPPIDQEMIIVDSYDATQYVDTLRFSNRFLAFKKDKYDGDAVGEEASDSIALYSEFYFNHNPEFLLWAVFITIGLALVGALVPILWYYFWHMKWKLRILFSIMASVAIVVVFIIAHYGVSGLDMLPPRIMSLVHVLFDQKGEVLHLLVLSFMLPPLLALACNFNTTNRLMNLYTRKTRLDVRLVRVLKARTFTFLIAAAIMLVMGIITSSLLRKSIIAALGEGYSYFFPPEFVLSYSLTFTFFLVVFFGPSIVLINDLSKRSRITQIGDVASAKRGGYSMIEVFELFIAFLSPILVDLLLGFL